MTTLTETQREIRQGYARLERLERALQQLEDLHEFTPEQQAEYDELETKWHTLRNHLTELNRKDKAA